MGKTQHAFSHHLDQVPEAELVAQVPANAQDDHPRGQSAAPQTTLRCCSVCSSLVLNSPKDQCTRPNSAICARAVLTNLRTCQRPTGPFRMLHVHQTI